jgi:hypothetical protein
MLLTQEQVIPLQPFPARMSYHAIEKSHKHPHYSVIL